MKTRGNKKKKILVTGATGNIGKYVSEQWKDRYEQVLMVHSDKHKSEVEKFGKVVQSDMSDIEELCHLFEGIDTVVHLAGDASPEATWESVLNTNMKGTYNIYIAAKKANVKRVIYASSIHAISAYPIDRQVRESDPVNPGDIYGVSKCFGEALGRYFATQQGLSNMCLRIGAFQPPESISDPMESLWMATSWVSHRDLAQLLELCIENKNIHFGIFNALSNNRGNVMDISLAKQLLGYNPEDDFSKEHSTLKQLDLQKNVKPHDEKDSQSKSGIREEIKDK